MSTQSTNKLTKNVSMTAQKARADLNREIEQTLSDLFSRTL